MVAGLDAHAWFGLVVYFAVSAYSPLLRGRATRPVQLLARLITPRSSSAVAIVLYPLRIKVPNYFARIILAFLVVLRLRDPPLATPTDSPVVKETSTSSGSSTEDIELTSIENTPGTSAKTAPTKSSTGIPSDTNISAEPPAQLEIPAGRVGATQDSQARTMCLVLDLRTAPVIGVLLLLASKTIEVDVLRLGIVGEGGVRPFDVLVLFISLVCILPCH